MFGVVVTDRFQSKMMIYNRTVYHYADLNINKLVLQQVILLINFFKDKSKKMSFMHGIQLFLLLQLFLFIGLRVKTYYQLCYYQQDIQEMSSVKKSKKTTVTLDKSVQDISKGSTQKLNQQLNLSQCKMLKKLSMSFYAEDTIKKNKQVIFDDCEHFEDTNNYSDIRSCKQNGTHNKNNNSILKNKSTKQSISNGTSTLFFRLGQSPKGNINAKHKSLSKEKKVNKRSNENIFKDKDQKIQKLMNKLKKLKLNQVMEDNQVNGSHFQHFDNFLNPFQLTVYNKDAFPNQKNKILYRKENKSTTPLRVSKTPQKSNEANVKQQQNKNAKCQNRPKLTATPNRIKSTDKIVKNKELINWFKFVDQKGTIKAKQCNSNQLNQRKKEFF